MGIWGPVGREGSDEIQADSGMAGRPAARGAAIHRGGTGGTEEGKAVVRTDAGTQEPPPRPHTQGDFHSTWLRLETGSSTEPAPGG